MYMSRVKNNKSNKLQTYGSSGAIKWWKVVAFPKKANGGKGLKDTKVCQPYMGRDG